MTDREMIEEMAEEIKYAEGSVENWHCRDTNCEKCEYKNCKYSAIAEDLYDEGYRKIPEDSVVLTKEEIQIRDYECYNLGYEVGKKETRKETAREILNIIDTEIEKGIEYCKDDYRGLLTARVLIQLFCREQYGVDIEE